MKDKTKKIIIFILLLLGALIPISVVFLISKVPNNYPNKRVKTGFNKKISELSFSTPEKVRGIYLTGYSFANKKERDRLISFVDETIINTMVIDIKDTTGKLMFSPQNEKLKKIPLSKYALKNVEFVKLLKNLEDKKIYTIARITTFQDPTAVKIFPELALKNRYGKIWKNYGGVSWLDMTNKDAWEIPVLLAKEAYYLGFDEVQFDYIRFPSDGNLRTIKYKNPPKGGKRYQVLKEFYSFLDKELENIKIPRSIDLFGLTYKKRKNKEYDLNIGQRVVDAGQYFDYLSPMVYPSHYPVGYMGFKNPALFPYEIINDALKDGEFILKNSSSTKALSRPWLQDFNMGAFYGKEKVKAQIKACDENNVSGWILWNPYNRYTKEALLKD